jgi:hypothetical protein
MQFASYDDESNSKRVRQLYSRMILRHKAGDELHLPPLLQIVLS